MFCNKCGNEIKEGELFCPKCGNKIVREETNEELEKKDDANLETQSKEKNEGDIYEKTNKNDKKLSITLFTVIALCVIICVALVILVLKKKSTNTNEMQQIGASGQVVNDDNQLSFSNMKTENDNINVNEDQRAVLQYLNNNYFGVYSSEDLQRYPNIYKNSQVRVDCKIKKIIKSDDNEFICMGVNGYEGYDPVEGTLTDFEEKDLFVVKSVQLDERLIVEDEIIVYGTCNGVETFDVDGKTYTVPVITATSLYNIATEYRYDLNDISKVAKYIFGNDIKITKPDDTQAYGYDAASPMYIVTLDNQTNANFKEFAMLQNYGYIGYTNHDYQLINKSLYIAADFEHFIVITYEDSTKKLYIDYYDRAYNKMWGREFDYKSGYNMYYTPMDYTSSKLSIILDNELYLIDLKTGEDVIEPVLVGTKVKITMLSDYMVLIGNENKNAIMMVDYKGNIIKKFDADTDMTTIYSADTQIVDNRMVIEISGELSDGYYGPSDYLTKYIVLNSQGEIELSTKDKSTY